MNFKYYLYPDKAVVTGLERESDAEIIIPKETAGRPITEIDDHAFHGCTNIRKITIPETVTSIGRYAFSNCTNLEEIILPKNLEYLGTGAFLCCESLEKITMPKKIRIVKPYTFSGCNNLTDISIDYNVRQIDPDAFGDCLNLVNIKVAKENKIYADIDGILFDKDITQLILYPAGRKLINYTLPDTVKHITGYAMSNNPVNIIINGSPDKKRKVSIDKNHTLESIIINTPTEIYFY